MNTKLLFPTARIFRTLACLAATALLAGCFETKDEFTLNPDGSGKVVHESSFQNVNLSGDNDASPEALKEAIAKVIEAAKGVEAWRDVTFARLDDGRLHFKGTAYFKDLAQLDFPNQTMLEFDWKKAADDSLVLTLRTNKGDTKGTMRIEKKPVDLTKLTPEERAVKLKEERAKFQQSKPMLAGFMGTMKHEVVLHLPGQLAERSNFTVDPSGALRIQFDGAKLLDAMSKLVDDDAWAAKNLGSFGGQEKPAMDDEVNAFLFGSKAPVRAVVHAATQPTFDYATEVAAAKLEFAKIQKQLGTGPLVIAAPAQGGAFTSLKVVGVQLVSETDKKREIRPFNEDAGFKLALLGEFPGSVLGVTEECGLDTAIADDGSDLLPSDEWKRRISFPRLSADKSGVLFEAKLSPPGPGVKGLKELSGHLQYSVASATKEIDLGFTEVKAGASGTELGAKIESIGEGWKKDGSQQLELKLKIKKEGLKAVWLKAANDKVLLVQRGYSGGGNSYSFTFESKTAFPADAHLIAEIYDQLQTYNVPFKLENLSLLGAPLTPAK